VSGVAPADALDAHPSLAELPPLPEPGRGDAPPLAFGIYPGGDVGTPSDLLIGKPNDPRRIAAAMDALDPGGSLLVRGFVPYVEGDRTGETEAPRELEQYAVDGRRLDIVLVYRPTSGELPEWVAWVRDTVRRFGRRAAAIQVTEEPNLAGPAFADGGQPNVRAALVAGVIAAYDEARSLGLDDLQIGFNALGLRGDDDDFWRWLGGHAGADFREALGYVGVDLYPGVFGATPATEGEPGDLRHLLVAGLQRIREHALTLAGISAAVPLRITESGWPTGPGRSEQAQAAALTATIRAAHEYRSNFNVTHLELFDLRDADSTRRQDYYGGFGLLRDDYSPKPAFDVVAGLIADLT
jgi:hypothetical protein